MSDEKILPPDPELPLWRYMSLWKYCSMLQSQSLWFTPLTVLAEFDRFEGITPPLVEARARQRLQELFRDANPERLKRAEAGDRAVRRFVRWTHAANCWRSSAVESAVMWSAYAPRGGLVVKSSYSRLVDALGPAERGVFAGRVRYADLATEEEIPVDDYRSPAFLKAPQYEEEREVRTLIDRGELFHDPASAEKWVHDPGTPGGEAVRVDLAILIEEVRVSPGSPEWHRRLVQDVSRQYGLDVDARSSELDLGPEDWLTEEDTVGQ